MSLDSTGVRGKLQDMGAAIRDGIEAAATKVREAPKKLWEGLKDVSSGGRVKRWWASKRVNTLGERIQRSQKKVKDLKTEIGTFDPVTDARKIERLQKQIGRQEAGIKSRSVERQQYGKVMYAHYERTLSGPKSVIESKERLIERVSQLEKRRDAVVAALGRFSGDKTSQQYETALAKLSQLNDELRIPLKSRDVLKGQVDELRQKHAATYERIDTFKSISADGMSRIESEGGSGQLDVGGGYGSGDTSDLGKDVSLVSDRSGYTGEVHTSEARAEKKDALQTRDLRAYPMLKFSKQMLDVLQNNDGWFESVRFGRKLSKALEARLGTQGMKNRFKTEQLVALWNKASANNPEFKPLNEREKKMLIDVQQHKDGYTLKDFGFVVYLMSRSSENNRSGDQVIDAASAIATSIVEKKRAKKSK